MTKILVIDDEISIANTLKDSLELQGYEVEMANSGEEGLEKAVEFLPDIITLDLEMPGLTGFEVLQELKSNEKTKDIVVLILTIRDEKCFVKKGFILGAKEFLVKPFSIKSLGEIIKGYASDTMAGNPGMM